MIETNDLGSQDSNDISQLTKLNVAVRKSEGKHFFSERSITCEPLSAFYCNILV